MCPGRSKSHRRGGRLYSCCRVRQNGPSAPPRRITRANDLLAAYGIAAGVGAFLLATPLERELHRRCRSIHGPGGRHPRRPRLRVQLPSAHPLSPRYRDDPGLDPWSDRGRPRVRSSPRPRSSPACPWSPATRSSKTLGHPRVGLVARSHRRGVGRVLRAWNPSRGLGLSVLRRPSSKGHSRKSPTYSGRNSSTIRECSRIAPPQQQPAAVAT